MKCKIDEKEARKMLEEMGATSEMIDNFINGLPKTDEEEEAQIEELRQRGIHMYTLQQQYDEEEDPFEKSAIAARKISLGLE